MGRAIKIYPKATEHPTIRDIAWTAGFYEGEGFCTYDDKGKGLRVAIGQNDKELLNKLLKLYGGIIYGPYKNAVGNECYRWEIFRERASGFMFTIYSFLSQSRRTQFRLSMLGIKSSRVYKKHDLIPNNVKRLFK